jgi:hypothetical protein
MGGPHVQEREQARPVDGYCDLHRTPDTRLDANQHVQGNCWLAVCHGGVVRLIIVHHLDDEYLLAMLLVAQGEQLVALEAFAVFATLSDLLWREEDGAGLGFVDRA